MCAVQLFCCSGVLLILFIQNKHQLCVTIALLRDDELNYESSSAGVCVCVSGWVGVSVPEWVWFFMRSHQWSILFSCKQRQEDGSPPSNTHAGQSLTFV